MIDDITRGYRDKQYPVEFCVTIRDVNITYQKERRMLETVMREVQRICLIVIVDPHEGVRKKVAQWVKRSIAVIAALDARSCLLA